MNGKHFDAYVHLDLSQVNQITLSKSNVNNDFIHRNIFKAHLMELEPTSVTLQQDLPAKTSSGKRKREKRAPSECTSFSTSNYHVYSVHKNRNVPERCSSEASRQASQWTPQLIKCLEGVTLNKVTLKQYKDLYSDLATDE
jgi:hypothetical protein